MFKKLLPILGLLLLVSCEGELTEEQIADAVNGTGTVTVPPPPPKPITNWLDKAEFLTDKTCTVTSTTLTDDDIANFGSNATSVNYLIGQEFKLGSGTYFYSTGTGRSYLDFESSVALNGNARMFIGANKEETHNTLSIGTPSSNDDAYLSTRSSYTLDDEGNMVGTMQWIGTDVGRDGPGLTMFDQETEVFTITLKCK